MKDKIICLVGESGSGKSTIAELLEKEGYNYIESYTTRPPRYEGERGHIFVDCLPDKDFYIYDCIDNRVEPQENVIAYTFFSGNHYWATREQYRGKGTSIYVVDPVGVKKLKEAVTDAEIVVIYLRTDTETRIDRMWKRKFASNGDLIVGEVNREIYSRLYHDLEKFQIVECDYAVGAGGTKEHTLSLVKQVLGGLE